MGFCQYPGGSVLIFAKGSSRLDSATYHWPLAPMLQRATGKNLLEIWYKNESSAHARCAGRSAQTNGLKIKLKSFKYFGFFRFAFTRSLRCHIYINNNMMPLRLPLHCFQLGRLCFNRNHFCCFAISLFSPVYFHTFPMSPSLPLAVSLRQGKRCEWGTNVSVFLWNHYATDFFTFECIQWCVLTWIRNELVTARNWWSDVMWETLSETHSLERRMGKKCVNAGMPSMQLRENEQSTAHRAQHNIQKQMYANVCVCVLLLLLQSFRWVDLFFCSFVVPITVCGFAHATPNDFAFHYVEFCFVSAFFSSSPLVLSHSYRCAISFSFHLRTYSLCTCELCAVWNRITESLSMPFWRVVHKEWCQVWYFRFESSLTEDASRIPSIYLFPSFPFQYKLQMPLEDVWMCILLSYQWLQRDKSSSHHSPIKNVDICDIAMREFPIFIPFSSLSVLFASNFWRVF